MKKTAHMLLLFGAIALMPQLDCNRQLVGGGVNHTSLFSYPVAEASGDFKRLNLNLKKLKEATKSMKQFDKLEEQGLPKRQVDLMRKAMESKISVMMMEVIMEIRTFQ